MVRYQSHILTMISPQYFGQSFSRLHIAPFRCTMSTLVAGYESSDDESQPALRASTSTLPYLASPANNDEDEDDVLLEEQARRDTFGLSAISGTREAENAATRTEVMAAPDVLKEVSFCMKSTLTRVGPKWSWDGDHRSSHRQGDERQYHVRGYVSTCCRASRSI